MNQTLASNFGFMELADFFLPAATGCSCVRIVGATLGGGIGYYSGLHGIISDSLLSARTITGKGELLTASATSNSDLFWAIKGAGFNYGVVTEATFQQYDQRNGGEAMNADMMFSASANGSVWKAMAGFCGQSAKGTVFKRNRRFQARHWGAYDPTLPTIFKRALLRLCLRLTSN